VPTPNPRVVLPRHIVPNVVDEPVEVTSAASAIRTPPCTPEHPTYGIVGLFHVLPPALAWLWRLIAPRGHANPSIVDTEGMSSEGVGSYWPFATGRRVDQANLLLRQIQATTAVDYVLFPNQHIGCWAVGFMPQWIGREYFARRGSARFGPDMLVPARLPLLGRAPMGITVEGQQIPRWLFHVELQREIHADVYDEGARQLQDFAARELDQFLVDDLDPLGVTAGRSGVGPSAMDRPSAPSPPAAPPEVRDVELGEIIGTGSSGTVYRGRQPRFHRDVAVKVVASHGSPSAAERWDRELSAMGRLSNHPNILPVYAGGVTEAGAPYLVMPYVPDGTLRDRLRDQGPMPPAVVASIGAKLAGALAMAHQAGVLHRDVKPENVLMSPYGEPQLADFGIARLLDATLTAAGTVTATIPYAAPEVLDGAPATEAADVYGLGATLHACLTGEAPFVATEHDTMVSLVTRVATQDPPSLREAGVPAALADVVDRAMAKDPAARHASATELQRDLDDAATRLARREEEPAPTEALPAATAATTTMARDGGPGLAPTAVVAAPAASTTGTRAAPAPRPSVDADDGNRRWTTFLGALVALAVVAVIGWWFLASDDGTDDTATADRGPVEVEEAIPDDTEPADPAPTAPAEDATDAEAEPQAAEEAEPTEPAGTSGDAVGAAVRYFETLDAGDLDGAWALTTTRFRERQDRSSWAGFWSGFGSIAIAGEPRPAGDGAVIVPLSLDGQREDYRLLLVESDGGWLVDGPTGS
jgi:hypothetical protein